MFTSQEFKVVANEFSSKLLSWMRKFDHNAFLNSNEHSSEHTLLAAAGCIRKVSPEKNCFYDLDHFLKDTKDKWSFGFLSYDLKNELENLSSTKPDKTGFPLLYFFQPELVFSVKGNTLKITSEYARDFHSLFTEIINTKPIHLATKEEFQINSISKEDYLKAVRKIQEHIQLGDIYEMNYCQEFYASGKLSDPYQTYLNLNTVSPAPFSCFLRVDDIYLISASPERFLKKVKNKIISQPIKGTAKRGHNEEEDSLLAKRLRESPKEQNENVMVVDLTRNDLSRFCKPGSVRVEELFGIYSYSHVHQMISTVTGELKPGISNVEIIKNSFPMASMTGVPKLRAMEIIEKYELSRRGLYSGTAGYFAPDGDFDFNVIIRSILYNASWSYISFTTGSAITAQSDPEEEYKECLLKAQAIMDVLNLKNENILS